MHVAADVTSQFLPTGAVVSEMGARRELARVDGNHTFRLAMQPHQGRSLTFGT